VAEVDSLRRFIFEGLQVRGEIVRLDAAWRQVLEHQDYPPAVRAVLGEALAATVLLASTLKFDGTLTLQLQGDGPMYLLVAQCTNQGAVRGLAKWEGDTGGLSLAALTGDARLAITIERGAGKDRYQGIVPVAGESLADCLDHYFAGSIQVPTRLWLATGTERSAGMLLQRLPESVPGRRESEDDDWERLLALAGTLRAEELLGLGHRELLGRLFAEDDVRLFGEAPVTFACSCDRERVATTLKMLGRSEISQLIAERGLVEVRCEFCNRPYRFDPVDAEALFADTPPPGGPATLH
jgi:molecular chaperone Hsp33